MTPAFVRTVPAGDTLERSVCARCGFIAYDNPKIVVGAVVVHAGRVLLCRRDIEPSRGLWTLPAGYLEHGETPEEGAAREAFEEATCTIAVESLLAVYTIRRLGQVQLIFRARLVGTAFAPGVESQAVGLFAPADVPERLAFPSVHWALAHFAAGGGPHVNPPDWGEGGPGSPPLAGAAMTRS